MSQSTQHESLQHPTFPSSLPPSFLPPFLTWHALLGLDAESACVEHDTLAHEAHALLAGSLRGGEGQNGQDGRVRGGCHRLCLCVHMCVFVWQDPT